MSADQILKAFEEVTKKDASSKDVWVSPYSFKEGDQKLHQFVFS